VDEERVVGVVEDVDIYHSSQSFIRLSQLHHCMCLCVCARV